MLSFLNKSFEVETQMLYNLFPGSKVGISSSSLSLVPAGMMFCMKLLKRWIFSAMLCVHFKHLRRMKYSEIMVATGWAWSCDWPFPWASHNHRRAIAWIQRWNQRWLAWIRRRRFARLRWWSFAQLRWWGFAGLHDWPTSSPSLPYLWHHHWGVNDQSCFHLKILLERELQCHRRHFQVRVSHPTGAPSATEPCDHCKANNNSATNKTTHNTTSGILVWKYFQCDLDLCLRLASLIPRPMWRFRLSQSWWNLQLQSNCVLRILKSPWSSEQPWAFKIDKKIWIFFNQIIIANLVRPRLRQLCELLSQTRSRWQLSCEQCRWQIGKVWGTWSRWNI